MIKCSWNIILNAVKLVFLRLDQCPKNIKVVMSIISFRKCYNQVKKTQDIYVKTVSYVSSMIIMYPFINEMFCIYVSLKIELQKLKSTNMKFLVICPKCFGSILIAKQNK